MRSKVVLLVASSLLVLGLVAPAVRAEVYIDPEHTFVVTPDVLYQSADPADPFSSRHWALHDTFDGPTVDLADHQTTGGTKPWRVQAGGSVERSGGWAVVPEGAPTSTATAYTPLPSNAPLDLTATVELAVGRPVRLLFRADVDTSTDALGDHLYLRLEQTGATQVAMELHRVSSATTPNDQVVVSGTATVPADQVPETVHIRSTVHPTDPSKSRQVATLHGTSVTMDLQKYWTQKASVGFTGAAGQAIDEVRVWHPLVLDRYSPVDGPAGPRPAVVVIHGGAFSAGDKADLDKLPSSDLRTIVGLSEEFASRGFETFSINYRTHLSDRYVATLPGTVDRVTVTGPWTMAVDGASTAQLAAGASAASVQSALEGLAAVDPGDVAVTDGPAPATYTLTWADPVPRHTSVSGSAALTPVYDHLLEQLEATPTCAAAQPAKSGAACHFALVEALYKCVGEHGGQFPPAESDCPEFVATTRYARAAIRDAQHDAQSAVRHIKANAGTYGIDPSEIFVTGESAGAMTSLAVAFRPEESPQPNDTAAGGQDVTSVVAGALPYAAPWMADGTAGVVNTSTPVSVFQFDLDTVSFFPGALPLMIQQQLGDLMAAGVPVDYNALNLDDGLAAGRGCGYGHQVPRTSTMWLSMITEMVAFVDSVRNGGGQRDREGVWAWAGGSAPIAPGPVLDVLDRSDRAFTPIVGDFVGDGTDDVYWYAPGPSSTCTSLWIGSADGTVLPVPTFDPGQPVHAAVTIPVPPVGADPHVGDFDGDGHDDIFWYGSVLNGGSYTVTSEMWWGGASTAVGATPNQGFTVEALTLAPFVQPWAQVVVGDFGAGHAIAGRAAADDLYFLDLQTPGTYNGWDQISYGNAGTFEGRFRHVSLYAGMTPGTAAGYEIEPLVGRFDADAWDDIYWYGRSTLADGLWYGADNTTGAAGPAFVEHAMDEQPVFAKAVVGDFGRGSTQSAGDDVYFLDIIGGAYAGWDRLLYAPATRGTQFQVVGQIQGLQPPVGVVPQAVVGQLDGDAWDDIVWHWPGATATWRGSENPTAVIGSSFVKSQSSTSGSYVIRAADVRAGGGPEVLWHRQTP